MAKGQKKSNREVRKPKKDKPTANAAPHTLTGILEGSARKPPGKTGR